MSYGKVANHVQQGCQERTDANGTAGNRVSDIGLARQRDLSTCKCITPIPGNVQQVRRAKITMIICVQERHRSGIT